MYSISNFVEENKMAAFTREIEISKPIEEVFQYITDVSKASKIMRNVIASNWITAGPIMVGAKFKEVREIRGKKAESIIEVIAYEPNKRYSVKSEMKGLESIYHYHFTESEIGTIVQFVCDVEAYTFMMKLTKPMFIRILQKEDGNHLENLKREMEKVSV
jgi:hypothetical protein